MHKRKILIAGNWKMHGTRASITILLDRLAGADLRAGSAELAVFPPFVFLHQVSQRLKNSPIAWGAQNVAVYPSGAYTGEVSAPMLAEFECRYVLVGHSERRQYYGENDTVIAQKIEQVHKAQMSPILCVGETLEIRQQDRAMQFIQEQLKVLIGKGKEEFVIAYEPVWAIGTGLTPTSSDVEAIHTGIRQWLYAHLPTLAENIRILYGGSVKADNANSFLNLPNVDGVLVGGASLDAEAFLTIYYQTL